MRRKKTTVPDSGSLELKERPPRAGEVRKHLWGEAMFFSPRPMPTWAAGEGRMAAGEVLEVNETYMDIGQSNCGKAFQVQAGIGILMGGFWVFFMAAIAMGFGLQYKNYYDQSFFYYFKEIASEISPPLGYIFLIAGGIYLYAILYTTFRKSRQRPLRLNRQRREVCFFPKGRDEPAICPWEEVVAWVALSTGSTGTNLMQSITFGMALPYDNGENYWLLHQDVMLVTQAQEAWETMRRYMDEGPECWPRPMPPETRATFDDIRYRRREMFKRGTKRWFWSRQQDIGPSWLGLFWFYFWNLFCFWKFPYWVAEWDQKYSMKPMPASIDEWSAPLPEEQWTKPSPELLKEKAELEQFYREERGTIHDFYRARQAADVEAV
ncbi:hypothetical protein ADIMK_1111 [Marinobacterium lacunae]|uniref:Transmembrane protein n=1 Tax=Marinobacterium lacunae TaxID=1232683 RepID=A0A081G1K3_9GAMM|nr:DUF6708 domain-containing protein [Marinobacterium lacunae]KEA64658.1 hypothetical protein ADIMK_1111 [Marinobacterium lacunae]